MKKVTTEQMIKKETHCPTLCIDCKDQCKEYKLWLDQREKMLKGASVNS